MSHDQPRETGTGTNPNGKPVNKGNFAVFKNDEPAPVVEGRAEKVGRMLQFNAGVTSEAFNAAQEEYRRVTRSLVRLQLAEETTRIMAAHPGATAVDFAYDEENARLLEAMCAVDADGEVIDIGADIEPIAVDADMLSPWQEDPFNDTEGFDHSWIQPIGEVVGGTHGDALVYRVSLDKVEAHYIG
ncbi:hypothetical protein ACX8Z9_04675 [Arthrobacter halodurans]|uniref:Uncharacterized protein n=1 Tax=Arthrobacter halodurans TaxID=516699 RepID=A0ABV4UTW8_9MICC